MLLLHLGDLLGVLLVHLLQLVQHALAALAQRLLVVDELVDEGQVPLDGGLVLLLLQLEAAAQLALRLLDVPRRQLPLLGLQGRTARSEPIVPGLLLFHLKSQIYGVYLSGSPHLFFIYYILLIS